MFECMLRRIYVCDQPVYMYRLFYLFLLNAYSKTEVEWCRTQLTKIGESSILVNRFIRYNVKPYLWPL